MILWIIPLNLFAAKAQIQYSNTFKLRPSDDVQFFQINSNKSTFKFQKGTLNLKGLFDDHNYVGKLKLNFFICKSTRLKSY